MGKANDKQTFLMSKTWLVTMDSLPDEALIKLTRAVIAYQMGKEVVIDDPVIAAIFKGYEDFFKDNEKKYKEQCERNAQIAKERSGNNEPSPVVTSRDESLPVVADTDTDTDIGSDTDIDSDSVSENESLTGHKNICSEQAAEQTVVPDCEALILNDGSDWWPTVEKYSELQRLYPNADVQKEFAKMRAWCIGNPTKRKTKAGAMRFVTNWLNKAQDGGRSPTKPPDKFAMMEAWARGEYDKGGIFNTG